MQERSDYLLQPANDLHDDLLALVRDGLLVAFRWGGQLRFAAPHQLPPDLRARVLAYADLERTLRRREEAAMGVWN